MKNEITELVFILDKSGSMHGLETDTIGGFNSLIEKQKNQIGECFVSTIFFSNSIETFHDRINLKDIKPLVCSDYVIGGCTALLDAIGTTIRHIETIHKYIKTEEVPNNTIFVIITDGMENASHSYSSDEIKSMIELKKEASGWEFLFLGANIDAVETAKSFGITKDRAVTYYPDCVGTLTNFEAVSNAACCIRENKPLKSDWKKDIEEHFKQHKNNH